MKYLLDTCVISELVAVQPDPQVVSWVDGLDSGDVYLSAITLGEIQKGIEKLPVSKRRKALSTWINEDLLVRFSGKILPVDVHVMLRWGNLTAGLEKTGRTMSATDSLIAAIALNSGFHLVTRNEDDFIDSGVHIVNPWTASEHNPDER